ncbi:MAG TPA: hypothetical protein VFM93_08105 [Candidatus Limnocylindria bacterium]|nr:hypothetical protein [Candidatus Limnocylindria bacterium]
MLVKDTLPDLGDAVMISIDIDINESADQLRRYADQNGFPWRFALAPRDMVRALGDAFGTQFLTPPSEPMFMVDAKGEPHLLPFGRKSAEALRAFVRQYRAA